DLLFSHELMRFVADRKLAQDRMYRVDRHDVPVDVPPQAPLDEQLEYCGRNRIRLHTRQGTINFGTGETPPGTLPRAVRFPGRLIRAVHRVWKTAPPGRRVKTFVRFLLRPLMGRGYPLLHTNACGDFTLLSRDAWFRLRGYAELDVFSMHLDSLLVH